MKILHILNSLLPSGAESMLFAAKKYWDTDQEHHILSTFEDIGIFARSLSEVGYTVHHIHFDEYFKHMRAVTKFIKENDFEVVHIHTEARSLDYEIAAWFAGSKKIVRTVHNVFAFTGNYKVRKIMARAIGNILGVVHVAIGKSVYWNEKKRFCNKCKIINNWYNEEKFRFTDEKEKRDIRKKMGISDETRCIVSVGNCSYVKNHMAVLKAIADIVSMDDKVIDHTCTRIKVEYWHIGKGEMEEDEKRYADRYGISGYIHFEGFQDPLIYLQMADLFVMPSRYEGVSIAALEALAIGLPCLFTDVDGLRDFYECGFDNLTCCIQNDMAIRDALWVLIQKGSSNSKKQSDDVKRIYGIKQGVHGYQEIYRG